MATLGAPDNTKNIARIAKLPYRAKKGFIVCRNCPNCLYKSALSAFSALSALSVLSELFELLKIMIFC